MTRPIKFRAWGKNIKEYLSVDGKEPQVLTLKDISNGCIYDIDLFEIEQYTGLKDKNGKEIYEGDIIQIDDYILGDFEVVWHSFGWKIKRSVGYESLSVHKSEDCTVIGTVHENPDLLGGKK